MSNIFNFLNLFNSLSTLQKSLIASILAIIMFAVSTGVSYSVFAQFKVASVAPDNSSDVATILPGPAAAVDEEPNEPRTESCPLNGRMHTQKAKDNWEKRLPLAVMIENHYEARPQSGLSSADIVYEAVAEGGITRFMAVYLCNLPDVQVGPIRSARTYFIDWESEIGAIYTHVGGANTPGPADALSQIIKYSLKDLNQFSVGFPTFWRDYQRLGHSVSTEHTMYSTTQKLWDAGSKRGLLPVDAKGVTWLKSFVPWKFKDDGTEGGIQAPKVDVTFWQNQPDYQVTWNFDQGCNCYKRDNAGAAHMDLNNNQQLSAKVIVVQFQVESRANDGYPGNAHLLYKTIGQGTALVFQDGKVIEGKWQKPTRISRTKYLDKSGKEIVFNRGLVWIETVPDGSKVMY